MNRLFKRLHKEEKGFTLVELLVVIAILAILVAVVVPNFTGLISRGTTEAQGAEKKTVQTIVDSYMANDRIAAFTAVNTIVATVLPSGAWAPGTTDIGTFFRAATKCGYSVAVGGLVTQTCP